MDLAAQPDTVERPHVAWWLAVLGGLGLLAVLATSPDAYAGYAAHVHALPSQRILLWMLAGAAVLHVGEAAFCYRLAKQLGMEQAAAGWLVQTLLLGFPSTRLLLKRKRAT